MHNVTFLFAWTARGLTAVFSYSFADLWEQLNEILAVPESVQLAIVALIGSAVATAVEYLIQRQRGIPTQKDSLYWLLKIGVGWAMGVFGGSSAEGMINASPIKLAFLGGIMGYGAVVLLLAQQQKRIDEISKEKEDKDNG